jgi:hypothetical protein
MCFKNSETERCESHISQAGWYSASWMTLDEESNTNSALTCHKQREWERRNQTVNPVQEQVGHNFSWIRAFLVADSEKRCQPQCLQCVVLRASRPTGDKMLLICQYVARQNLEEPTTLQSVAGRQCPLLSVPSKWTTFLMLLYMNTTEAYEIFMWYSAGHHFYS